MKWNEAAIRSDYYQSNGKPVSQRDKYFSARLDSTSYTLVSKYNDSWSVSSICNDQSFF